MVLFSHTLPHTRHSYRSPNPRFRLGPIASYVPRSTPMTNYLQIFLMEELAVLSGRRYFHAQVQAGSDNRAHAARTRSRHAAVQSRGGHVSSSSLWGCRTHPELPFVGMASRWPSTHSSNSPRYPKNEGRDEPKSSLPIDVN
jgi:hypothetical protein